MKLKRNDIYLIATVIIIVIVAGLYIFLNKKPSARAVLKYNKTESMEINLSKNQRIDLKSNGINIHISVKDGAVAFVDSECPDHICERYGYIKNVGESAICLPAQASLTVIRE